MDVSVPGGWEHVRFKLDRIYKHRRMHVNFTTYDIRRADDVITAGSAARGNIMVLNPELVSMSSSSVHPFWYARVLDIFHADIFYTGEGNRDYHPRRIEFLWVRWYEVMGKGGSWVPQRLDQVKFPTISDDESFGFVDPGDVLRGCHIIPSFNNHPVASGHSPYARDSEDCKFYFVNRWNFLHVYSVND